MVFCDDLHGVVHQTGTAVGLPPLAVTPLPMESTSAESTQDSSTMAADQRRESSCVDKVAEKEKGRSDVDGSTCKVVFNLDDDEPSGDDEDHPEATEHPGPLVRHPRLQRLYSSDSGSAAPGSPGSSMDAEADSGIFTSPDSSNSKTVLRLLPFSVFAVGHG